MFIQGVSGVNHLYYRKLGGIFSNSSFLSQGEVGREKSTLVDFFLVMLREGKGWFISS